MSPNLSQPVRDEMPVGTRVKVRTRYSRAWSSGFEVAEATTDGYLLRRDSDRSLLPVPIIADDVRRED